MQHDYSVMTQRIFATIFGIFALVGPVIGVTYSDSFGVRANIAAIERAEVEGSETSANGHEKFFCSTWAGDCSEKKLMNKIDKLIKG